MQSGDIAEHLNYVQHHVRTRLDEAKQREMARLRDLMQRKVRGLSGNLGDDLQATIANACDMLQRNNERCSLVPIRKADG